MPLQSGQVSKLRLYESAQQARHENSRETLFLEESELWILSRISHHESETGLKQVYTIHPFLELGDLEGLAILILNHLPLETPALCSLRSRYVLCFLSYQHQRTDDESYYVQVFCAGFRSIHSLSFLILISTKAGLDCQCNVLTTGG